MANKKKQLPATTKAERLDEQTANFLRADNIVKAINANLPEGGKPLPRIPKTYVFKKMDRESVSVAFHSAFQLIGGLPKFVAWANTNPGTFYALYAKLLPSETQTPMGTLQFNFQTAIPETPQDRIMIDEGGKIIDAEIVDEELPE